MRVLLHIASVHSHFMLSVLPYQVAKEAVEDEALEDEEKDGNDVPLGKMIQRLKSQGNKSGKAKKKKSSSAEVKTDENDVDILKMVREINMDNVGATNKFESSNGHKHPSKIKKLDSERNESKKRKYEDETPIAVPKRQRSSSGGFRSLKNNSKTPSRVSKDGLNQSRVSAFQSDDMDEDILDSEVKTPVQKRKVKRTKSDSMSRAGKNRSSSSKRKRKGSDSDHDDEQNEAGESDNDNTEVSYSIYQFLGYIYFIL